MAQGHNNRRQKDKKKIYLIAFSFIYWDWNFISVITKSSVGDSTGLLK